MAKLLAIGGLALALAGVLILFRFGMPFRVERKGNSYLLLEEIDDEGLAAEARYRLLGYVGLAATVAGTVLQIASVVAA